jgi:hypothetical protein
LSEHGLGDAAFGLHKWLILNYKRPLADIPENKVYNLELSRVRVCSEHTIGLVKERFQGPKKIRLKLRKKSDLQSVLHFISAGYVLHNILYCFIDKWGEYMHTEEIVSYVDSGTGSQSPGEEAGRHLRETVKR